MKKEIQMMKKTIGARAGTFLAGMLLSLGVLAADPPSAISSLVVPKGMEARNPTTEIAVGFGDVSHISPWQIKRRFPRTGDSSRSGQLVTLRDALLAVNELVAKDEEMPEHTFAFDGEGKLTSVCDVPFAQVSVLFDGTAQSLTAALLDEPVRDFGKVEFQKAGAARKAAPGPVAAANAQVNAPANAPASAQVNAPADDKAETSGERTSGTTKTITLPGGAKMEMIWCAPGQFLMGSPLAERGRFDDEPQHQVTLTKGFWLGKYEVTQKQWESVMGDNPSKFKDPDRPVESVSWEDCNAFIRRLNADLGGVARFPTEAEWEYACRAGSSSAVSGNGLLSDMAWYDANSGNETHPVGKNHANAWGFFDMHGNVLEWCYDWFGKFDAKATDPKGPSIGSFRVLRGGCWFFYARDCRSAYRLKRDPALRNAIYGFRLACSEPEK